MQSSTLLPQPRARRVRNPPVHPHPAKPPSPGLPAPLLRLPELQVPQIKIRLQRITAPPRLPGGNPGGPAMDRTAGAARYPGRRAQRTAGGDGPAKAGGGAFQQVGLNAQNQNQNNADNVEEEQNLPEPDGQLGQAASADAVQMIGTVAMGQLQDQSQNQIGGFGQPGGGGPLGPDTQGAFGNTASIPGQTPQALAAQGAPGAEDSAAAQAAEVWGTRRRRIRGGGGGRRSPAPGHSAGLRESTRLWERSDCYASASIARTTVFSIPLEIRRSTPGRIR